MNPGSVRQGTGCILPVEAYDDDADSIRADPLDELATELWSIADRWNLFKQVRGSGQEYLAVPYTIRFNTLGKASDIRDGFTDALYRAAGQHDRAALVSVTTDPKPHDSALDVVGDW